MITPLDVKNFTHHNKGSIFGLDILKADNPGLSPRSGIKNLFFTGQDIFAHGLTPLNGVITASVVTGKNLIKKFGKIAETINKWYLFDWWFYLKKEAGIKQNKK